MELEPLELAVAIILVEWTRMSLALLSEPRGFVNSLPRVTHDGAVLHGLYVQLVQDIIKTKIRHTVSHTQEFFERFADPFFPVLMIVHEGFSCCGFANRRPVMEN